MHALAEMVPCWDQLKVTVCVTARALMLLSRYNQSRLESVKWQNSGYQFSLLAYVINIREATYTADRSAFR